MRGTTSGNRSGKQHPITWRSLLDVLKELDLSQEIEDYMHGEQGILHGFVMNCVECL